MGISSDRVNSIVSDVTTSGSSNELVTVNKSPLYIQFRTVPPVTLQVSVAVCPGHSGPGSVRTLLAGETNSSATTNKIDELKKFDLKPKTQPYSSLQVIRDEMNRVSNDKRSNYQFGAPVRSGWLNHLSFITEGAWEGQRPSNCGEARI